MIFRKKIFSKELVQGLSLLLVIALPSLLDDNAARKAKACGGKMGQEYLLPENSTVAVAISRDHAVQH